MSLSEALPAGVPSRLATTFPSNYEKECLFQDPITRTRARELDDLRRQRRNASNARALPSGVFGPVESPP